MKFSDEVLMAYVDGEVDDALRAEIEAAMVADRQLAAAVAKHQRLRDQVRSAFGDTLNEPVPDRLTAILAAPPAAADVVDMASVRAAKPAFGMTPRWYALAATLLLGVGLGLVLMGRYGGQDLVAMRNGQLVARGRLNTVLTTRLSGQQSAHDPVRVGFSFASRSGAICRTFEVSGSGLAGFACRRDDGWRVQMLMETGHIGNEGAYRQAGSALSPALASQINALIVGDPLDAGAEAAARARGWRR